MRKGCATEDALFSQLATFHNLGIQSEQQLQQKLLVERTADPIGPNIFHASSAATTKCDNPLLFQTHSMENPCAAVDGSLPYPFVFNSSSSKFWNAFVTLSRIRHMILWQCLEHATGVVYPITTIMRCLRGQMSNVAEMKALAIYLPLFHYPRVFKMRHIGRIIFWKTLFRKP